MNSITIFTATIICSVILTTLSPGSLQITSTAFMDNSTIPYRYTCEGQNINPPLRIGAIPDNAKTLALVVEDPDAPNGTVIHWMAWNIPVTMDIAENSKPGTEGYNTKGQRGYMGPCPPTGTHHYIFNIYALDTKLALPDNATRKEFEKAIQGHILAKGQLTGLYKKSKPIGM